MTTFYLINQPESTWMKEERFEGISDTSLTKLGKAQATKIGRYYSQKQIDGILTSRLNRASQCAKIIRQFVPFKLIRDERLNDINLGSWQGKFPEEIETRFPKQWQIWHTSPDQVQIPDGEHLTMVQSRLNSLIEDYSNNSLFSKYYLLSTHDIIVRVFLSIILKKPLNEIWKYKLIPGSVTELEIYPEKRVVSINNIEHLL